MMLFKKRKIQDKFLHVIIEACNSCITIYEDGLEDAFRHAIETGAILTDNPIDEEEVLVARNAYLTAVEQEVNAWYLSLDPPGYGDALLPHPNSSSFKLRKAQQEVKEEYGFTGDMAPMAGRIYATLYYAEFNAHAKPGDCIAFNHEQQRILQEADDRVRIKLEKEFANY